MATTLNRISEQVQRLYARGIDTNNPKPLLRKGEVKQMVVQAVNEVLGAQTKQPMRLGRYVEIPHCMIATYPGIAVTGGKATLPAYPISLPHNMGVWEVNNGAGTTYIPMCSHHWTLIGGLSDVSGVENQVSYYVEGDKVIFTDAAKAPTTVTIKLLVADVNTIGDDDLLPLSAEYETAVIERVVTTLKRQGIEAPPQQAKEEEDAANNPG